MARYRLLLAFVLSLLVHASLYSFWAWGKSIGLWQHQATWLLHKTKKKAADLVQARIPPPPSPVQKEIPLTFMEVDPAAAAAEAPKEAKFYGALNSVAANAEPEPKAEAPKADGSQDKVPRVANVPKPKPIPFPLQPAPPPPAPARTEPEERPLQMAKPVIKDPGTIGPPIRETPPEPAVIHTRPRTLQEARQRLGLAGQKLRQEGGVARRGTLSFDVKASDFGTYDAAFIAAVQKRWYDLLDTTPFPQRSGKVVLEFRLTYDGRITEMAVSDNEVGEILSLLCQRAVLDPAPYAEWPSDMRRKMGNHRDVRFTFYYN